VSTAASSAQSEIEKLTFEQAMKQLEEIVRRLEGGNADLESAIADYMYGTALQQHCQKKLSDAKLKIESIVKAQDGTLTLKNFETQE
jgi:exodeoxyribonuclease VII small subunit